MDSLKALQTQSAAELDCEHGDGEPDRYRDDCGQACHLERAHKGIPNSTAGGSEICRRILEEEVDAEQAPNPVDEDVAKYGRERNQGQDQGDDGKGHEQSLFEPPIQARLPEHHRRIRSHCAPLP